LCLAVSGCARLFVGSLQKPLQPVFALFQKPLSGRSCKSFRYSTGFREIPRFKITCFCDTRAEVCP